MPTQGLHTLERSVLAELRARKWPPTGSQVLVAVSGGRDSIALLRILHALQSRLQWHLQVVHFNHALRPECTEEAAWVTQQAEALGVVCWVRTASDLAAQAKIPLTPDGKGPRPGLQGAARTWRMQQAQSLAQTLGAVGVALGHHQEDHLETLLLQWRRGVHMSRWLGIAPQTGIFFRPLLQVTRPRITAYLKQQGQRWLEDPTNASLQYTRNRLRHQVIPQLDQLLGATWRKRLLQTAQQAASLNAWVEQALPAVDPAINSPAQAAPLNIQQPTLCTKQLQALPQFLQSVFIHRWLKHHTQRTWGNAQLQRILHLLQQNKPRWGLDGPRGKLLCQHNILTIHPA